MIALLRNGGKNGGKGKEQYTFYLRQAGLPAAGRSF